MKLSVVKCLCCCVFRCMILCYNFTIFLRVCPIVFHWFVPRQYALHKHNYTVYSSNTVEISADEISNCPLVFTILTARMFWCIVSMPPHKHKPTRAAEQLLIKNKWSEEWLRKQEDLHHQQNWCEKAERMLRNRNNSSCSIGCVLPVPSQNTHKIATNKTVKTIVQIQCGFRSEKAEPRHQQAKIWVFNFKIAATVSFMLLYSNWEYVAAQSRF